MKNNIQVPATITGIRTTSDNGMSLTVHTQELSPEMKLIVMEKHNAFGWLLFGENKFTDADIPDTDAPDEKKTPSQRLRAVIYRYFETKGLPKEKFQEFYLKQLEGLIDQYKARLG